MITCSQLARSAIELDRLNELIVKLRLHVESIKHVWLKFSSCFHSCLRVSPKCAHFFMSSCLANTEVQEHWKVNSRRRKTCCTYYWSHCTADNPNLCKVSKVNLFRDNYVLSKSTLFFISEYQYYIFPESWQLRINLAVLYDSKLGFVSVLNGLKNWVAWNSHATYTIHTRRLTTWFLHKHCQRRWWVILFVLLIISFSRTTDTHESCMDYNSEKFFQIKVVWIRSFHISTFS